MLSQLSITINFYNAFSYDHCTILLFVSVSSRVIMYIIY